jgi:hypothetical protein
MVMEDLWRLKKMAYRLEDLADKVEYDHMLKRFKGEEEKDNRDRLLYGADRIVRRPETSDE